MRAGPPSNRSHPPEVLLAPPGGHARALAQLALSSNTAYKHYDEDQVSQADPLQAYQDQASEGPPRFLSYGLCEAGSVRQIEYLSSHISGKSVRILQATT